MIDFYLFGGLLFEYCYFVVVFIVFLVEEVVGYDFVFDGFWKFWGGCE